MPLPDAPGRRNLVIVRAGDDSLHPQWLGGRGRRDFDLLVSYYGDTAGRYCGDAEHYHTMPGPRWPAHAVICREHAALLAHYDYVAFACDDLAARRRTWNALFAACRRHSLDLAQPAIEGEAAHAITHPVPGCRLRYTNFVEVMCPVFSRRALQALQSCFGESRSGWGLDLLWQHLLPATWPVAIIDSVRVRHCRPLRQGTLYSVLETMGVVPEAELAGIVARYRLPGLEMHETGRVALSTWQTLAGRARRCFSGSAPAA